MFTGKADEEEYETQVPPELVRRRTLSMKNGEDEERKVKREAADDL